MPPLMKYIILEWPPARDSVLNFNYKSKFANILQFNIAHKSQKRAILLVISLPHTVLLPLPHGHFGPQSNVEKSGYRYCNFATNHLNLRHASIFLFLDFIFDSCFRITWPHQLSNCMLYFCVFHFHLLKLPRTKVNILSIINYHRCQWNMSSCATIKYIKRAINLNSDISTNKQHCTAAEHDLTSLHSIQLNTVTITDQ